MEFFERITGLLRAMDDDALAALANRGLLRRAKKDLETITPKILEVTQNFVRLQVDDCEVTIPEVPAEARSSSPAGSIDRYVLVAFLWFRDRHEPSGATPSREAGTPARILPDSLDDAALVAWAGKAAFLKTEKLLDGSYRCVIDSEKPLVIKIPERNIVCHWIDDGNPETMIVTGPGKNPRENGLLALMLYQIEKGTRSFALSDADALEGADGAPRTRLEVLNSLGEVLHEMIFIGLSRLSGAARQRLQTLAVSAHGVDLPRLERTIQGLSDEIRLQTSRNAQASTSRILLQAARLEALRRALLGRLQDDTIASARTPLSDLVGEHRSRYHSVGNIDLIGMGARQWKTKSGYVGLTAYFWDDSSKNWASWSESRPLTSPDFDPVSVFHGDGPWNGCPGPAFASRNILKLIDAYRNENGRLSARKNTQAIPLQIDDTDAMILPPTITDWNIVQRQAEKLFHGGLASRNERDEIVFLKPGRWDDAMFDPAEQTLYRTIYDGNNRPLALVLSYDPELGKRDALDRLENYDPSGNRGILGLIRLHRGMISVEPVSFFDSGGIHSLTLDTSDMAGKRPARPSEPSLSEEVLEAERPEDEMEWADEMPRENPIAQLLEATLSELEMIAESGLGESRSHRGATQKYSFLEQHANRLETVGLEVVSKKLKYFLEAAQKSHRHSQSDNKSEFKLSATLLYGCYLVQIALQSSKRLSGS